MVSIFKRVALVFALATIFSACLLQSNVEAGANIDWTTTDVILEYGKCTVKGYFTNSGDVGGTVTNIKFIVDVKTSKNGSNIYSAVWNHSPKNVYIPAGAQISWNFWLNDEHCPSWSKDGYYWVVSRTISYK